MTAPPDPGPRKGAGPVLADRAGEGEQHRGGQPRRGAQGSDPDAERQPDLHRARLDHEAPPRLPKLATLLVGLDPEYPGGAVTVVLAAVAAINGLKASGEQMSGRTDDHCTFDAGKPATIRALAAETGFNVETVRTALLVLQGAGHVERWQDGVLANPGALAARWAEGRRIVIKLTKPDRMLGLHPETLLVLGLIRAKLNTATGQLLAGVPVLAELLAMSTRAVERHLQVLRNKDIITTWKRPTKAGWRMGIALGPRPKAVERPTLSAPPVQAARQAESGGLPGEKCRSPQAESDGTPGGKWRKTSGCTTGSTTGSPPDVTAAAVPCDPIVQRLKAEPAAAPAAAAPERPAAPPTPTHNPALVAIETWIIEIRKRNVERLDPASSADRGTVAALLGRLDPPGERPSAAIIRERLQFGADVIRWCPEPERLARWLSRAVRWLKAERPGAYLRRAVERGRDHSTLLGVRPGWRDFTKATERQLEGDHAADVQRLVELGAATMAAVDEVERHRLRDQFGFLLSHQRPVAARAVLLRLVGNDQSDVAIARAVGDVATLAVAKQLLRGVA